MEKIGKCTVTQPESVQTLTFPWGDICLLSEPTTSGANALTFASVEVQPGTGHERHNHPNADEIIYVVEGEATQMLDDRKPITITPGTCIFVPRGIYHGTQNTGNSVLKLIVVYVPGGEESVLRNLPDVIMKDPVA